MEGEFDQAVVVDIGGVGGVVPQETKPSGQSAQHGVADESVRNVLAVLLHRLRARRIVLTQDAVFYRV